MIDVTSIPQFDAGTLEYDVGRYDFPGWTLREVRAYGFDGLEDLTKLHEVIAYEDLPSLTKHLIDRASKAEFQEMAHAFVMEYMAPLVGADVAVQRYPNFRAVLPSRGEMRLPWHQGIWVGHGWGEATMWTPVTRAFSTNSMYIMDLATSRRLTEQAMRERWSRDRMEEEFPKWGKPCDFVPGQCCTFTEGNIHGNAPNDTGVTRMSFDFRVLVRGGQFFGKPPAGYFTVPGTYEPDEAGQREAARAKAAKKAKGRKRSVISYCEINAPFTKGAAVPLQRLSIQRYCDESDLKYRFEHVELIGLTWSPILKGLLDRDQPDDLILYSIFSLPSDATDRAAILEAALEHDVTLHFANENEVMLTAADRDRIEKKVSFSADWSHPVDDLKAQLGL